MSPHRPRRLLLGATALIAAAAATAAILPAQAEEPDPAASTAAPALAAPTGPLAVGTTQLHLVDRDRPDPWFPDQDRQLMVTMWFPTEDRGATAPYMTEAESAAFAEQLPEDVPADYFAAVGTNAVADAEPVDGELPLVMLSPGWSFPRATLTGLAEELASQGFAVAAVGHNFEAPMELPDGTLNTCLACPMRPEGFDVTTGRAADLAFVLDELTQRGSAWRPHLDRDRIAVGGHSMGGSAAHTVMQTDDRFGAGFNLDGALHDAEDAPIEEPFLLIGNAVNGIPGEADGWLSAWPQMDDWKRWIRVEQTTHSSFTDMAPLADDLGIPIQEMEGARIADLTRAYVTAFVKQALDCEPSDLFDGPSQDWPEAVFEHP
ncbi:alpha/beta hydrolase [Glycomyces sp. NPDC047369]